MEDVLRAEQSSLTALPHPPSTAAAVEAELAPPNQPSPEIVDEPPTRGHHDMDLDASLWEHCANEEEYIDAGEEGGREKIYTSKTTSESVTLYAY